ncbi:hypothetical protein TWF694_001417 [Orbilia ellipsospora]|uniref:Heterokaryon incompatibility domain-containing protein n=1 Tax=Orbilia ellipsospora TaxID=2528407 RepID=A0AAV9XUX8_9PEZI
MSSLSNQRCKACKKLPLATMFAEEAVERKMGLLSDYSDPTCQFCQLIETAVSRAGWNFNKLCSPTDNEEVPELFVQSKSPLSVKHDGHIQHLEPRLQIALNIQPPGYQAGRPTIREFDRNPNRFIIAEIELLPDEGERRIFQRRSTGTIVDPKLVNSWIEECNGHKHSKKSLKTRSTNSLFLDKDGFLLVDVIDLQLVRLSEPADYVALSYVWGEIKPFIMTSKNIDKLKDVRDSLSETNVARLSLEAGADGEWRNKITGVISKRKLPRTILDAMEFTRRLGIRYFWVDHLCITQDNAEEMALMIGRMDDIYDNATVTLIGASGPNSEVGLMGVNPRSEGLPIKQTAIVDDSAGEEVTLNLAICPQSLTEEIRRTKWNTRCWTYQEQCLSQRCVYFTPNEVFFNCSEMQRREAYVLQQPDGNYSHLQVRTGPPWWNRKYRNDPDPSPYRYMGDLAENGMNIREYQTAVQDYALRELTYKGDVFNAFEGIYNHFNGGGGQEERLPIGRTKGFPLHFLWQAILWFPAHSATKRVVGNEPPEQKLPRSFSSWSWTYWTGQVDFVFMAESLWLSRNISLAPLRQKQPQIHSAIPRWYYSDGSGHGYDSCDAWRPAADAGSNSSEFLKTKTFLEERLGFDALTLVSQSLPLLPDKSLRDGDLGFPAAYIPASDKVVHLEKVPVKQACPLKIDGHDGEFRYDSIDNKEDVEEFILVVAAETIHETPRTVSILLGLVTKDGISRRVGLGYLYYRKNPESEGLPWQYRYFQVA